MLNKLKKRNKLHSKNKIIKFDYRKYMSACKIIAEDIKNNYNLSNPEDIELIGMARGGIPMLVTISHLLGIRRVSIIQTQMSNSDNCHDYGKFRYISDNIRKEKTKCILFEDIIYKGITTTGVLDILKKRKKSILAVYSLIIDEGFKNIKNLNNDVEIKYVYEISANDWVYFLWEENILNID